MLVGVDGNMHDIDFGMPQAWIECQSLEIFTNHAETDDGSYAAQVFGQSQKDTR